MKNTIKYYYNLNPINIHQVNKKIKFNINDKKYMLYPTTKSKEEINDIYKLHCYLLSLGIYCHKIILNVNNEIITLINKIKYVLVEISISNKYINIKDILYYANIKIKKNSFPSIQRKPWKKIWIENVEFIEYQMNQFEKKYKLLNESYDYYIGIAEICISLITSSIEQTQYLTISHNRLNHKTLSDDFYNPFEFILDKRVRDIGEYIKNIPNKRLETLKIFIKSNILNYSEIQLLFVRILYPSPYFDIYNEIINERKDENEIKKNLYEVENIEKETKKIYNYIRSISDLPEIEWLN